MTLILFTELGEALTQCARMNLTFGGGLVTLVARCSNIFLLLLFELECIARAQNIERGDGVCVLNAILMRSILSMDASPFLAKTCSGIHFLEI